MKIKTKKQKNKKKKKALDEYCFLYSGRRCDSVWFMLVNTHPTQTFRVSLYLSNNISNLVSSRGSYDTIDCVPPNHQQILNVLSLQQISNKGYSYSAKYVYEYVTEEETENIFSIPPLDDFHQPLEIIV